MQDTLVELVDLLLLGKQLHWNVVGPLFRPLHLHLDELIDSWRELSDTVSPKSAPSLSASCRTPRLGRSQRTPSCKELSVIASRTMLSRTLTRLLAQAAERIRARMERLSELDAASEDVLVEVLRALEQQLWMVRAQRPA